MSLCSTEGCNKKAKKKGMCIACYTKSRRHKKPGDEGYIKCSIANCTNHASYMKKYCEKHHYQLKTYGHTFKTRYDKNEIVIHDDYAEIIMENVKTKTIDIAKVSLSKLDLVKTLKWSVKNRNIERFARATGGSKLHRLICEIENDSSKRVLFKNGDSLDCRDENMIVCNISNRQHRCKLYKTNSSGVKGVCFDNRSNQWRAYINVNGTRIELGLDSDKNKAIKLRKEAEALYLDKLPNK